MTLTNAIFKKEGKTMQNPRIFRRENMITVPQFARALGMSRRWAYEQIEKGQGGGGVLAFRFGGRGGLRIPQDELERVKRERRIEPGV